MRTFVTIYQGTEPRAAIPILATEDPEVVGATVDAVARRLGRHLGSKRGTRLIELAQTDPRAGAGREELD
jgi:hypothetical protein